MATAKLHGKGSIVPADYELLISYYLGSENLPGFQVACKDGNHHGDRCCVAKLRTVFETGGGDLGICCACGARYAEGDVWLHVPTNEIVHIGHECAAKYSLLADRTAYEMQMRSMRLARKAQLSAERNRLKREKFLADHPGLAEALAADTATSRSLQASFMRWQVLSAAQVALAFRLHEEASRPKPEPVEEKYVPAPLGRVTFEGVVVSKKQVDSNWGMVTKIVVKVSAADGIWLCYLTATKRVDRGETVTVTATLEAGRDPHFAFGKRPRIEKAAAA